MTERSPQKIPLIFFRTGEGIEPVREWLKELPGVERAIGGRTDLPTRRTARVPLCHYREHLVALHGFIKKMRATPNQDLALARKRQRELMR
jgi:phage-related protein